MGLLDKIPGVPENLPQRLDTLENTMTEIRDLLKKLVEIEQARD